MTGFIRFLGSFAGALKTMAVGIVIFVALLWFALPILGQNGAIALFAMPIIALGYAAIRIGGRDQQAESIRRLESLVRQLNAQLAYRNQELRRPNDVVELVN